MVVSRIAYVELILVNPTLLRGGASLEESIAVTCSLQLEGITAREVLRLHGDKRSEEIDFRTEAIATSKDPNVEVPRKPLNLRGTIPYYYCCHCGTPLKPGKCKGCRRIVPDRPEFRNNQATAMPYRGFDHLTHKGRYVFSKRPKLVETKRKPRGEITQYW